MSLIVLSVIYFATRIVSYKELLDYKERAVKSYHSENLLSRYENFELLHILTIAHSISCFVISGFVYLILRGNTYTIDRRQYFTMIGLTGVLTTLYFFSLTYVVYRSATKKITGETNSTNAFDEILDLIASLSNNTFSFIIAIMKNFVMIGGVYCLNVCSMYLIELATTIE